MRAYMGSRSGNATRRRGIAAIAAAVVAILAGVASGPADAERQGGAAAVQPAELTDTSGNFLLRRGAFSPLPDFPGAEETVHNRINNRGETVGISAVSAPAPAFRGFVQRKGVFRRVDVRGAQDTVPLGINDHGQIAGVWVDADGAIHSFVRDRDGDTTRIAVPGAVTTAIYDINNRGQVVGDFTDAEQVQHGFVWERGKVTIIDPPGVSAAPGGPGTRRSA
jgi:probable HAF family extracellular repeat protein